MAVGMTTEYYVWGGGGGPVYALRQLWSAWNNTPDVENSLAGWNALVNDTSMTPCVPESPWRGVFCNAVSNSSQSTANYTVWDLEIVSL